MARKKENPIRKTTKGKGANYRPTKKGAGMTAKGVKAYTSMNKRYANGGKIYPSKGKS